jgi:ParB family chromosome partitioning protein
MEETGSVSTVNGVNTPEGGSASGSGSSLTVNAVNTSDAPATAKPTEDGAEQPRRLPYDDAFFVVNHLHVKMEPAVFVNGARVWLKILREQHPAEYRALLQELSNQE